MQNVFNRSETNRTSVRPAMSMLANVPLNIPLLFSGLGAMVACVALFINQQIQNDSLSGHVISAMAFVVMVVTVFYMAYELYRQIGLAWYQTQEIIGICTTALLSSFLLGLIALTFLDITQFILLSGCAVGIITLSLIGLLLLGVLRPATSLDTAQQPTMVRVSLPQSIRPVGATTTGIAPSLSGGSGANEEKPDIALMPLLPSITASTSRYVSISDTPTLPARPAQEIQGDPLNYTPHLQQRRSLFFTVSKTDDPRTIYNEDICVISPDESAFVLCDGAAGSQLPRAWGFYLGQQWLQWRLYEDGGKVGSEALSQWLEDPRQNWTYWVLHQWRNRTNERNRQANKPPVTEEILNRVLREGAAATFLGLWVDKNKWYATAVGDTCLFQISADTHMVLAMPVDRSASFTQTPPLLASRSDSYPDPPICISSTYRRGDVLLMATDALSQWILRQREQNSSAWQHLLLLSDQKSFANFIKELRQKRQIEEDDTTLIIIQL